MSAKANNNARERPIRNSYKLDVLESVPMIRAPIYLQRLCERLHMTPEETATVMAAYETYPVPPHVAEILHAKIDLLPSNELVSPPLFNTYAFIDPTPTTATGTGGRRKRRRSHKKSHKKRRATRRR
jgi:hypothetical protein